MKEARPKVTQENPKALITEIVKQLAKQWELVDDETKKRLSEEFKLDQIEYMDRKAKYDMKLTDDQRMEIKSMKLEMSEAREKRATKKKTKDLGKPKKASSSFIHFLSEQKVLIPRGEESYREWLLKVSGIWNKLTDAQKEKYIILAKAETEKYR